MRKSSKELADELDAQDRLKARGYIKERCPKCVGTGVIYGGMENGLEECYACDGKGFSWKAPLTK